MKGINLKGKSFLIAIFFISLTLISRILVSEKLFFGYDSINYALGVIDFSLNATRPHLPGSILFVKSIEFINYFIKDIHQSFLILIYIFSSGAVLLSYLIFLKYFDYKKSFWLTLFLLFNPMVWFYGAVTEIYVFDYFFASLVFFTSQKKNSIYFLPIIYAIFSGFRPSSAVLLSPFFIYLVWIEKEIKWSIFVSQFSLSVVIFLAWFIPLINNAGGLFEYFRLFSTNNPMESISFAQNLFRLSSLMFFLITPFIFILPLVKKANYKVWENEIFKILFLIVPAILFFILSHYSKGYALLIAMPLVLVVGLLVNNNYKSSIMLAVFWEISLFIFIPARETTLNSKLKPSVRKSGIAQIWIDRTFSDYSLTFNEISLRDKLLNSMIGLVEKTNYSRIFLDPTISQFGRALQFYFPNKEVLSVDFKKSKNYILFRNNEVRQVLLDKMNDKDIFIVRKDFYDNYLQNFEKNFAKNNLIVLSQSSYLHSTFENIVDSLFVRN